MKIDPYKHKECYLNWKEKINNRIPDLTEINSTLLLKYLEDMECGLNVAVSNKKGSRSYPRLNTLRQRLSFMFRDFESRYSIPDIRQLTEQHVHSHFTGMRNGTITQQNGKPYKSVVDYVKIFKAFWHWHQKTSRKLGEKIEDITIDLDTSRTKPEWVYLTSFENFGIIVMINPNKSSISQKYMEEIINADSFLVENSFEESSFGSTGFQYFKTESYTDDSKIKKIPLYHLILDVGNLLNEIKIEEVKEEHE